MPRPMHAVPLAVALSLSLPTLAAPDREGCPEGQTRSQGGCVAACPTSGRFDPGSCACPEGFGLILTGNGQGECHRRACPMGAAIDRPALCDCPAGHEKKRDRKGETRCVTAKARTARAKPE